MQAVPIDPVEFAGRVAIVTGAAQNIGYGIAARLAAGGASVVAFDKDADGLADAVERLRAEGGAVTAAVGDVTRRADVEEAVAIANREYGPVDALVNNAGIWITKALAEHTDDDWDRVISTNLTGTFLFCRAVLPDMKRARRGHIVNIASIAASYYTIPHASYAAAKAGVVALTRDLAYEVAPLGIRVNGVSPGNIPKAPRSTDGLPIGSGTAADIANTTAFLLSPAANYIVGVTIPVAGGGDLALNYGGMVAIRAQHLGEPAQPPEVAS